MDTIQRSKPVFLRDASEVGIAVGRAMNDADYVRKAEHISRNARNLATYQLKRSALVYANVHRCQTARTLVIHDGVIHVSG